MFILIFWLLYAQVDIRVYENRRQISLIFRSLVQLKHGPQQHNTIRQDWSWVHIENVLSGAYDEK